MGKVFELFRAVWPVSQPWLSMGKVPILVILNNEACSALLSLYLLYLNMAFTTSSSVILHSLYVLQHKREQMKISKRTSSNPRHCQEEIFSFYPWIYMGLYHSIPIRYIICGLVVGCIQSGFHFAILCFLSFENMASSSSCSTTASNFNKVLRLLKETKHSPFHNPAWQKNCYIQNSRWKQWLKDKKYKE